MESDPRQCRTPEGQTFTEEIDGQDGEENGEALTTAERTQAETYIRQNIGSLSTEDPVLGGTFYVTEIRWDTDGYAIVDYEDGHIALRSRMTATVNADGNVVITDVTLLQENPPPAEDLTAP